MPKKPMDVDKMLSESDAGRGPRSLKEEAQMQGGLTRPKDTPVVTQPEGPRAGQIKYKDYAPKDISPHGDLGMLDDKEQRAFFPNPIKGANAEWQSSKHLPVGNKPRVACDDSYMKPRVDYGSSVYPKHDKGDYSGLKAGSKKAPQRRGVSGNAGAVDASSDTNSMHPIVNKRQRNF